MIMILRLLLWVSVIFVLCSPVLHKLTSEGVKSYTVFLEGEIMGTTGSEEHFRELYATARRELAQQMGTHTLVSIPQTTEVLPAEAGVARDEDGVIVENILRFMKDHAGQEEDKAIYVKVNGTAVSFANEEQVQTFLQNTIDNYDLRGDYRVNVIKDSKRNFVVLHPEVVLREEDGEEEGAALPTAGIENVLDEVKEVEIKPEEIGFDSFELGMNGIDFSENVEIVEAGIPATQAMDPEEAARTLVGLQEEKIIYKVKSGDTLSGIALKVGLPLDEIIALNEDVENENSIIRVDQELLITVPEPELSVIWSETSRYREIYDLPTEYVYNDSWYSNKQVTLQQPSAGYRDAVVNITRKNDTEVDREVLFENATMPAVAKVVEIGTIVPPSYIKPISGGRLSSGFGYRNRPTAGASSYHKGIDLATPTGTQVWASSGGTVALAGWQGGYGNVVFINHPDGKQTRYGHLSKIYVSAGQTVRQGQVIAASGNTGVSTGPHLHFEIRIGGTPVDPRKYVNVY